MLQQRPKYKALVTTRAGLMTCTNQIVGNTNRHFWIYNNLICQIKDIVGNKQIYCVIR